MPFNGSGTFTRVRNWVNDAAAAIKIRPDYHDDEDDGFAAGLSQCIAKDGQSIVTADIPFNGHKLVNVGNPVDQQDAVTKGYLETFGGWTTSKFISGADADGRLNFTSLTGVNGITWTSIDAAWVAKKADASGQKERDRVVLNNHANCSGVDVIAIDDNDGALQFPSQFQAYTNLVFDGVSYRTPAIGIGGVMRKTATALTMLANSVATTLAYGVATLETWFSVARSGGTVVLTLNKKASGDHTSIYSQMDGAYRWLMQLGSTHAEAAGDVGSNFYLYSCTNGGATKDAVMWASRSDGKMHFPQGVAGDLAVDGKVTSTDGHFASTGLAVLAGETGCRVQPRGWADPSNLTIWDTAGLMTVAGYTKSNGMYERSGSGGSFGTQVFNFLYVASNDIRCYVGTSYVGAITPVCDYRIKREVQALPSTWDAVKALRPVRYLDADYGQPDDLGQRQFVANDIERWGFLAHELQEALTPSAANGEKDGPDLQAPNLMAIIAALTSALQEAQVRIEALEARP